LKDEARSIIRMQIGHQVLNAGKTLAVNCLKLGNGFASGVALGTLTSKGKRRSSATRSISKRMASEMDSPIHRQDQ